MKIQDCTHCIAVPGSDHILDVVRPDTGLTWHFGRTLEDARKEKGYEHAEIMLIDDFCKQKAARQDEPVTWKEVTRARYVEMLEALPPAFHSNKGFLVGEPWDHHAGTGQPRYAAFTFCGARYYESSRPMTIVEFQNTHL